MRCFFLRDGRIQGVEFLSADEDEALVSQARALFETAGKTRRADGFEVWDGKRCIYRFPDARSQD